MKPPARSTTIDVDFARLAGPPISHDRIALFNSGLVTAATYQRDASFFARSLPEHMRVDLGWGAEWMPWTRELVALDEEGRARYDFAETDEIAQVLNGLGVRPYWSYSYVPRALRAPGADWRTLAQDDDGWAAMVGEYARGAAERGVTIAYHEVYNEPDLRDERTGEPVFFAGDLDDYLALYRATATAIRSADPRALIGGPALASVGANVDWLRPFLDMIEAENLPLDFLSFHHYGTYGLELALNTVVGILDDYEKFDDVELHLNEYNSFTIDYPRGGLQDSYLLAAAFMEDAARILSARRLTRVSWAQFLDSGNDNYSGMIDIDGQPKPLFFAYEFLQNMPVDGCHVTVTGPKGVGALASSSSGRNSLLVWNRSSEDQTVHLSRQGAAGETGTLRLIDGAHSGDELMPFSAEPLRLARGGVACIEFGEGEGNGAGIPRRRVARTRFDYSHRAVDAWAHVDEADGTVRFGTGSGAPELRIGYDIDSDANKEFETLITFADGKEAPGRVEITRQFPHGDGFETVWFTLCEAPPGVFARVVPLGDAQAGAASASTGFTSS